MAALRREVLDPLGAGGSGRYLPTLWDPATDRATRAPYATAPAGAVLLLDGSCCSASDCRSTSPCTFGCPPAARVRRTGDDARWALPAYERYEREVDPDGRRTWSCGWTIRGTRRC